MGWVVSSAAVTVKVANAQSISSAVSVSAGRGSSSVLGLCSTTLT